MRLGIAFIAIVLSVSQGSAESLSPAVSSKSSKKIHWETSILKAMERAKKEDKPIFLELYADWCTYCKALETKVFPDPEVEKRILQFVPVRLNGEEYPNLMERYGARVFPTILFLDKYANYIGKLAGLPTKDLIIRETETAYKNSDLEKPLLSRWRKDPKSIPANFELGVYYYQTQDYTKSEKFFRITADLPGTNHPDLVSQAIYNLALVRMNNEKYKSAIQVWNEFMKKFPGSDNLAGAYLHRGIAWRELKMEKDAIKDLKKAKQISRNPEELEMIQAELDSFKD